MLVELASPWAQPFPRSVGLPPTGTLASGKVLRLLAARGIPIDLVYNGFALEPVISNGCSFRVDPRGEALPGSLVLCEREGWCDLLRVLGASPGQPLTVALDPHPMGRAQIGREDLIGVVVSPRDLPDRLGRLAAMTFPAWSRWVALRYWLRKIVRAPDLGADPAISVREKYADQVLSYNATIRDRMNVTAHSMLTTSLRAGASILIGGCGAGGEALQLAREGYRITALDVLPRMIEAARRNGVAAGLEIEWLCADLRHLDLEARRFDAVFITPLVYSFIPGRAARIDALRGLGRYLAPDGRVVFSAALIDRPERILQTGISTIVRRIRRSPGEFGDWYTRFMSARGSIRFSYTHLFLRFQVESEARSAGFRIVRSHGRGHFLASGFADP
ncbi:MAG: methyltransferase domain-containing protein [Acidobacteria bacterium]|nr:methyltransferase domain-containing protein [Acidobacteriota bacterium]